MNNIKSYNKKVRILRQLFKKLKQEKSTFDDWTDEYERCGVNFSLNFIYHEIQSTLNERRKIKKEKYNV